MPYMQVTLNHFICIYYKMMKSEQNPNELFQAASIYIPKEENCCDKLFQYFYYYCCFPCGYMYQDD